MSTKKILHFALVTKHIFAFEVVFLDKDKYLDSFVNLEPDVAESVYKQYDIIIRGGSVCKDKPLINGLKCSFCTRAV